MQLQDIENYVLFNTQQTELVNFGGAPNWSLATNPAVTQAGLDFLINRAYMRVGLDLADIQLYLYRFVFASIANVFDYPLPPFTPPAANALGSSILGEVPLGSPISLQSGVWGQMIWGQSPWGQINAAPAIQRVTRVIYNPVGQTWQKDFSPGVGLISWEAFMLATGFGYLRNVSYGVYPDICAIHPQRNILAFYPGTASAGDIIGVEYVPKVTPNSDYPPLANETDTPILPEETHDLIVAWTSRLVARKLREWGMAQEYEREYNGGPQQGYRGGELARIIDVLRDRSRGDSLRIRDAREGVILSEITAAQLVP